jgi:hypothetical protein
MNLDKCVGSPLFSLKLVYIRKKRRTTFFHSINQEMTYQYNKQSIRLNDYDPFGYDFF